MAKEQEKNIKDYVRAEPYWVKPHLAEEARTKAYNIGKFLVQTEGMIARSADNNVYLNIGTRKNPVDLRINPRIVEKWRDVMENQSVYFDNFEDDEFSSDAE